MWKGVVSPLVKSRHGYRKVENSSQTRIKMIDPIMKNSPRRSLPQRRKTTDEMVMTPATTQLATKIISSGDQCLGQLVCDGERVLADKLVKLSASATRSLVNQAISFCGSKYPPTPYLLSKPGETVWCPFGITSMILRHMLFAGCVMVALIIVMHMASNTFALEKAFNR